MTGRSKLLASLACVAACCAASAPPSLANPPARAVYPPEDPFVLDDVCAFPVVVTSTGDTNVFTFSNSSGDQIRSLETFPGSTQTFTNADNGRSVTVKTSGPGHVSYDANTLTATGPWAWSANPVTGEPGLFTTTGRAVVSLDSFTGSLSGGLTPLCPQID